MVEPYVVQTNRFGEPQHGKESTYNYFGCRCEACRAEAMRVQRLRRAAQKVLHG